MFIYPAIDLLNGQAVRLYKGDYNNATVYSDNPATVAAGFASCGATRLHLVDLDGARDGDVRNFDKIHDIVNSSDMFVQVGGGIRDLSVIERYLSLGVDRVIIGSAAVNDKELLKTAVAEFGDAVAVGVDARDGMVAIHGWTDTTDIDSFNFCSKLKEMGIKTIIYTDISRDGTLSGSNLSAYKKLLAVKDISIIASGGISFVEELITLAKLGAEGAIIGKALYNGNLDLEEVLRRIRETNI